MTEHEVQPGECLSSIAKLYGFGDWHTIYDDPANADFKQHRPNPNIIYPGDILYIPEKELGKESRPTDQKHRFQAGGPKTVLRLALKDKKWKPLTGKKYKLILGDQTLEGNTDGDGVLEEPIAADAEQADLTVWPDTDSSTKTYAWTLLLGHLDPVEKFSGLEARLNNLGLPCGDITTKPSEDQQRAIAERLDLFRARVGMTQDPPDDDQTRQRLVEKHDQKSKGGAGG